MEVGVWRWWGVGAGSPSDCGVGPTAKVMGAGRDLALSMGPFLFQGFLESQKVREGRDFTIQSPHCDEEDPEVQKEEALSPRLRGQPSWAVCDLWPHPGKFAPCWAAPQPNTPKIKGRESRAAGKSCRAVDGASGTLCVNPGSALTVKPAGLFGHQLPYLHTERADLDKRA